jgi:hypothetical protein
LQILLDILDLFCLEYNFSFYPGALRLAQERNKELEKQLKASEKAHSDAEAKAASAEDLRVRLNTVESALSEREEQISKREATIIARLDTQSIRFSSNVPFPFHRPLLFDYMITFIFIMKDSPFLFSRKIGEMYTRNQDLEEDALLDTLSILEMNRTLARDCLRAGRVALDRIFRTSS